MLHKSTFLQDCCAELCENICEKNCYCFVSLYCIKISYLYVVIYQLKFTFPIYIDTCISLAAYYSNSCFSKHLATISLSKDLEWENSFWVKKLNKIAFVIESFIGMYCVLVAQCLFTREKTGAVADTFKSTSAVYAKAIKFSVFCIFKLIWL